MRRQLIPGAPAPECTIVGAIGLRTVQRVARVLANTEGPLTIVIASQGGDVRATMAIYEMLRLRRSVAEIWTVAFGAVMSAAVLILVAGSHGCRAMGPHSRLMYHGSQAQLKGSLAQMRGDLRALTDHDREFDQIVADLTGNELSAIQALYRDGDRWLTPRESLQLGFVDQIIQPPRRKPRKGQVTR